MHIQHFSTMISTADLAGTQAFYQKHFGAQTMFDSPVYQILTFPDAPWTLHLMQSDEHVPPINGQGLCLNMQVADVDAEFERLVAQMGCSVAMPLEDHEWGDRGFSISDPNGVTVYLYSLRAPSAEYAECYQQK